MRLLSGMRIPIRFGKEHEMSNQREYEKGDRVRVIKESPGAPVGTEATVVAVHRNETNTIISLTLLIMTTPAQTHGTSVYPHEIELIAPASEPTP